MNSYLFIRLNALTLWYVLCLHYTQGIVGSTMARCHSAIFFTQAARKNETLCALCFKEKPINRVTEYKDCESSHPSIFTSFTSFFPSLCLSSLERADCLEALLYIYWLASLFTFKPDVWLNFFLYKAHLTVCASLILHRCKLVYLFIGQNLHFFLSDHLPVLSVLWTVYLQFLFTVSQTYAARSFHFHKLKKHYLP